MMISRPIEELPLSVAHSAAPDQGESFAHLPTFPDVNTNWGGFCIPILRLVGWRKGLGAESKSLTLQHELMHWLLTGAMAVGRVRANAWGLWWLIDHLRRGTEPLLGNGADGLQLIPARQFAIPLRENAGGVALEQGWAAFANAIRMTRTFQEVWAVWASLRTMHDDKKITSGRRFELESAYRAMYELAFPGFSQLFDTFKDFADTLTYGQATAFAHNLIDRANTPADLLPIVAAARVARRRGSADDEKALDLWLSSYQEGQRYNLPQLYPIKLLTSGPAVKFWFVPHKSLLDSMLTCEYDQNQLYFSNSGLDRLQQLATRETELNPWFYLWLESIRQQLVHCVGLECPFWSGQKCCGLSKHLRVIMDFAKPADSHRSHWTGKGCLS